MRAYREQIAICDTIVLSEIFTKVVLMPASRFWVSEERACIVIGKMMRGDSLHKMRPTTREMYLEIYRRVCSIKKEQPNKPLSEIVFQVVGQPAPQFYLTPDSARVIVTKIKRRFYEKNKKRLATHVQQHIKRQEVFPLLPFILLLHLWLACASLPFASLLEQWSVPPFRRN